SGTAVQSYSQSVTGLSPGTTYFFCAITSSAEGTAFGSVLSFTTANAPPTITSPAATMATPNAASLTASINPSGSATTAWFRYATVDPVTCNDTFGVRAPTTGGVSAGAGNTATVVAVPIASLLPATTYFFCALASNSAGTTAGAIASFTTPGQPATMTQPASLVTSTSASLNASTTPNGSQTALWFRYATTNPGTCDDTFGTRTPAMGGIDLGAGASPVATQQALTGLTPATTYFACAIAQNTWGTSFGGLVSFTTAAAAPAVTTLASSAISVTGATLNGSAIPNGAPTQGWFRYSTTNPGTCNDTFGTRAPATGGTSLGAGATPAAFSEVLSGLAPGTTYFACAIASSSAGLSVGAVISFSTPVPPTVTTLAPTLVTSTAATLNGEASPNGTATTGWFRYSTTNPGTCDDTFGTRAPLTGGSALGAGSTTVPFSTALTGLSPGTTYFFCAIAQSAVGLRTGGVQTFTTATLLAPQTTTSPATNVQATSATLNGAANPNGAATTGFFRYATTNPGTCNDTFGTRAPATGGTALGGGTTSASFSEALTGLSPGTTFYFCALAQSANGLGAGAVQTFTTPSALQAPAVLTSAATTITATAATLNGSANPNGQATTAWFRYATTNPGACDDVFGTRTPLTGGAALGSGSTAATFAESVTGLAAGTTYFFCALAQNATGTGVGSLQTFTTAAAPERPTVTTSPATSVTATSATLNGAANPNGQATTGWFRYATTSPGACDDAFGTRVPATGSIALGSGSTTTAFSEPLTSLAPGTPYFFCAIAQNATGVGVGSLSAFMTGAAPPVVTTSDPTRVTGTGATLNGTVDPRGSETLAWFRLGDSAPSTCDDAFGSRVPATGGFTIDAGAGLTPFTFDATGLAPKRTYFACAAASNLAGAAFGGLRTFTTPAVPPTVTTQAPELSGDAVVFRGAANPNGSETTGWFRHGPDRPQTCDDTWGTRVPASAGASLGSGRTAAAFSETVSGLPEGASYVCAIASNEAGLAFGEVQTISVPAKPGPEPQPTSPGCGCGTGGGLAWVAASLLLALRRR
ncbi:MAG: hypothetical protein JNJ54_07635, partial [Myxococcaceae bacterium]|nr:hypothetical protein [Myxococcaceae bacterium]